MMKRMRGTKVIVLRCLSYAGVMASLYLYEFEMG